jgi:2-C-methyl-D-erythritol 4-phosphate cytidylyltransferase/2-C-methyl-D-erythritol 2,4-cyclodiphosphate synthase
MYVSAIIAAGGRGSRFGADRPKQLLELGGRSMLQRSLETFLGTPRITDVVLALPSDVFVAPPVFVRHDRVRIVEGGARRQDSVARAFAQVTMQAEIVVIHDAARPFVTHALIERTIDAAVEYGAAIAATAARDTVKRGTAEGLVAGTLPREEIFLAQTPQAFRTRVLRDALALGTRGVDATDEAMLAEQAGHPVRLVEGDAQNIKITTPEDLALAEHLLSSTEAPLLRIGNGYDLHRLVAGRPLVLGGVTIPFEKGLEGWSDADAVCHAITDAILGAAGAGDIGRHFPDTNQAWRGANSIILLRQAARIVGEAGFRIVNLDVVVIAERPKLLSYVDEMRANVASAIGIAPAQVSIKGKTNEGLDSVGRGESISAHAVALVSWRGRETKDERHRTE